MNNENTSEQEMTRFERRKASTKARIVEAAERLMRDRGVDEVTIQDITEAADVGHGTFYLHFKTKGDVLRPLIENLSNQVHMRVDRAAHGATDPALRMALGMRVLVRAIAEDPLWSWYASSGTSFSELVAQMGTPPAEDIRNGLKSGRFNVSDLPATVNFINGAFVGMITALNEGADAVETADLTAELVLRVLGIPAEEAAQIISEPLEMH